MRLSFSKSPAVWWGVTGSQISDGEKHKKNPTVSGEVYFWVTDNSSASKKYAKIWIDNDVIADEAKSAKDDSDGKYYFSCKIDTTGLSNGSHTFWLYLYENDKKTDEIQEPFTVNNTAEISWWGVSDTDGETNKDTTAKPTVSGVKRFWVADSLKAENEYVNFFIDGKLLADNVVSEKWKDTNDKYFDFTIDTVTLSSTDHIATASLYVNGTRKCTVAKTFTVYNDSIRWWGLTDEDHESHEDRTYSPDISGRRMLWFQVPKNETSFVYSIKIDDEYVVENQEYDNSYWVSYTDHFASFANGDHTLALEYGSGEAAKTIIVPFTAKNEFAWWGVTSTTDTSTGDQSRCPTVTGTQMFRYYAPAGKSGWYYIMKVDGKSKTGPQLYDGALWVSYTLDTSKLENGIHTIQLYAVNDDSTIRTVTNSFIVANANSSSLVENIIITSQPVDVAAAAGTTAKFTVEATGADSYEWQVSGDNGKTWKQSGAGTAKSATLMVRVTAATSKVLYRCAVSNADETVYSDNVRIIPDNEKPVITSQPMNVSLKSGAAASFSVKALSATPLFYQWQVSGDNGKTWKTTGAYGANTAKMTVTASASTAKAVYRCAVKNSRGTTYTNTVSITLTDANPVIRVQPVKVKAKTGAAASFSVAASGAESYQWQVSGDNGKTWKTTGASGANTAKMTVTASTSTAKAVYRCAINNANGTVYSNTVSIIITNVKPVIRVQPVNVNAKTGTAVSFSVVAYGAASYQWQVSGDNGKTWKTTGASRAKTAALSVNATAATSKVLYRCAVTNDIGTLYSNSVKIVIG
ncbi:MAG: immunoglobulin domain-containing protein [Clostridia bacterium]|nr:immunoglobulin domain-containing protein [Clostridia bacterium]